MQKILSALVGALLFVSSSFAQTITRVESFTPTGDIGEVEQVHVQFSDFMFPLGTQNAPAPFTNSCESMGKGRWLNPKEWVFEFKGKAPARLTCEFKVTPGLKSQKGIPVLGSTEFKFVVSPPSVDHITPSGAHSLADAEKGYSDGIDPDQAFAVRFDKRISAEEVVRRFYFKVEGRRDPIPVKILDPKLLKKIATDARAWIHPKDDGTWHLIQPTLDFPNREKLIVELQDREGTYERFWKTRAFFKAEMTCSRENVNAPCSPVAQVELSFNSPVSVEQIRKIRAVSPGRDPVYAKANDNDTSKQSHEDRAILKGPFKGGVTYKIEVPKDLKDIRGRTLSNAASFPLAFQTGGLPVLAKFPGHFGVIEAETPIVPVSLRNIEKKLRIQSARVLQFQPEQNAPAILNWLQRVEEQQDHWAGEHRQERNKAAADYESVLKAYRSDIHSKVQQTALPLAAEAEQAEVIGIPITDGDKPRKGLTIVELESQVVANRILDRKEPFYVSTAVLVTDLGVHFKWGQKGPSLAWVTELKTGKPVEGADVSVEDCTGKVLAKGKTAADGTWRIENLPGESSGAFSSCNWQDYKGTKLVVFARKGDDFSFTLNSWREGIEPWRFNLSMGGDDSYWGDEPEVIAHTVLARDYLKPGQTVNMKHYIRQFHWKGFQLPKSLPKYVIIRHLGSDETWNLPVKFSPTGIANTDWKIPETANLGSYSISLAAELPKKDEGTSHRQHHRGGSSGNVVKTAEFDVEEFRLPSLSVAMRIPDPITAEVKNPQISLQGAYLSGGPASQLPVELRFQRKPAPPDSRIVGNVVYGQFDPVKTGIVDKKEESYDESGESEDGEDGESSAPRKKKTDDGVMASKLLSKVNLDAAGAANVALPKEVLDTDTDGEVFVALTYGDPSGEIHTMVRTTSVSSRDRYLGISRDFGMYFDRGKPIQLDLFLGDLKGTGVAGQGLTVDLFQKTDYTHRERLVGGFYGYHTTTETKKIGEICSGKSDAQGKLSCPVQVPTSGRYYLEAHAKDSHGKPLVYVREIDVYGTEPEAGSFSESDRMTLVPNQEEYETGDTAEIKVESPFRQATALVTFERSGVMEHQVVELSGEKPVIKLPIKPEHSPGVVVSVLAVRGRVGDPPPTGLLDLGRPAFKLGMVALKIGKKGHALPIQLTTDKSTYQVREKVQVSIETKPNAELALAVVDKALLKLKPNLTWDLLNSMIKPRRHSVDTFTLQMNIIGKRHYGKKATPFGGGGGNLYTRELLDSLVAWKPNLKADAQGKIKTEFKLNDAISGFVVVAVGTQGLDLYGTGKADIVSTQDLQAISSIPPTLRERDRLPITFVVRNATLKPIHVTASLQADQTAMKPQEIEIGPQSSVQARWEDQIPMGVKSRVYTLTATSKEGPQDKLKVTSKVVDVLPSRVIEGFLQQLGTSEATLPITFPKDAVMDKGGYRVQVQARLSEVPDSVTRYMSVYPFSCFEQQTSKAMALQDLRMWQQQWKNAKAYYDSNSLLKFFPEMQYGSLDLTAYVLQIAAEAGKANPQFALTAKWFNPANLQRMLEAVRKGMRGEIHVTRTWWPDYVSVNERIAAGEALSYYEPIQPADYEALKSIRDKHSLNHTLSLLSMLRNSPKSLEKSQGDVASLSNDVFQYYQFENTHLRLKEWRYWFFGPLSSTPDGLKARTLVDLLARNQKDTATKLLRALVEEMKAGYWDTTPGNAWGVIALNRFRQQYEKSPVAGTVKIAAGSIQKSVPITEKKPKAEAFLPIREASGQKSLAQTYSGTGQPWSFTLVEAALPLTSPVDHGYTISKSVEPIQEQAKGQSHRGDLYRVKLTMETKAPQSWVVLMDPVPTGASILSTDPGGQASIAFEERRMDRMQVFFEYVPTGRSEFTYTVRLNQAGTFEFPPTRMEAMYDPTQYGELPNAKLIVQE